MTKLPHDMTIGDKYGPAMEITDQAEADAYFELCVEHCMEHGASREHAERIERANLGYYAGYYSPEVRARVERLFNCAHPIFGRIAERGSPSADEALQAGINLGRKLR